MAKQRVRLSPEEVKQALQPSTPAPVPSAPFNNPFAAALDGLKGKTPKKMPAAARLRIREAKAEPEPSGLAKARRDYKAKREALAEAVKPLKRPARRDED